MGWFGTEAKIKLGFVREVDQVSSKLFISLADTSSIYPHSSARSMNTTDRRTHLWCSNGVLVDLFGIDTFMIFSNGNERVVNM